MTSRPPQLPDAPIQRPLRLAVLISGGGTTLQNLTKHIAAGTLTADISLVIASRDCRGVHRCAEWQLPCEIIDGRLFSTQESFSKAIFDRCREEQIDVVIMGGFLSFLLIPDDFCLRVMNIHPSIIPSFCGKGFYGRRVHVAAIERGVKVSGCTVHFADNEYDHGPIILQRTVPVIAGDTPDSLAERVFDAECVAYPAAIQLFADGRIRAVGDRVEIAPPGK